MNCSIFKLVDIFSCLSKRFFQLFEPFHNIMSMLFLVVAENILKLHYRCFPAPRDGDQLKVLIQAMYGWNGSRTIQFMRSQGINTSTIQASDMGKQLLDRPARVNMFGWIDSW